DLAAQIDHALNSVGSAGNRGDLRDTDDLAYGADAHPKRLVADAKSDDLEVLFHRMGLRPFRNARLPRTPTLIRDAIPVCGLSREPDARACCGLSSQSYRAQSDPCCRASSARASASAPPLRTARSNWKPTAAPVRASCPSRARRL